MINKKLLLTLACTASCLCFTNGFLYAGHKTAGEKLDKAIEATKDKANDVKEAAKDAKDKIAEKAEDAKEAAKDAKDKIVEKTDRARDKVADKIKS